MRTKTLISPLVPRKWDGYIGQERIKKNVKIMIEAAKQRKEVPDHMLFYGQAGIRQNHYWLAYFAEESGANIRTT